MLRGPHAELVTAASWAQHCFQGRSTLTSSLLGGFDCTVQAWSEGTLSAEIEYYLQGPEEEAEDGNHLACTPGKQRAAAASRFLTSLHSIPMSSHTTTPCGPTTRQVGAMLVGAIPCARPLMPVSCWHCSSAVQLACDCLPQPPKWLMSVVDEKVAMHCSGILDYQVRPVSAPHYL